jgi:Bacterial Ig-like domain (group 3)/Cep192 domain 4
MRAHGSTPFGWRRPWVAALLVAAAAAGAPATAAASSSMTFGYTGYSQAFQVPPGVTSIQVVAIGGEGGVGGAADGALAAPGGQGGRVKAELPVNSGELFGIWVGAAGQAPDPLMSAAGYGGLGGAAAGESSTGGNGGTGSAAASGGGGGGGASLLTDLGGNVILAAGGGGGSGGGLYTLNGGAGGSGGATPGRGAHNGVGFGGFGGASGAPAGAPGENFSPGGSDAGGGGGGGGYPQGGQGGIGLGGFPAGGGGAGDSYVGSLATASNVSAASIPSGNGQITISWTPPPAVTVAMKESKAQLAEGTSETFTATVKPTSGHPLPTGTVTFVDQSTSQDLATVPLSATSPPTAKFSTTALPHGTNNLFAVYNGDDVYMQTSSGFVVATVYDRHVSVSSGSLAFGTAAVGSVRTASVTVTNTGLDPVTMTSAAVSTGPFSIAGSSCAGATLAAGQTCTVTVQFAPTAVGSFTGSLTIKDNATAGTKTVKLSGKGQ